MTAELRMLDIEISCGLCDAQHRQQILMPPGWDTNYRALSEEHGFCPRHAGIVPFTESQCPGCTGCWGDCPLWRAFAYRERDLSVQDFARIEAGICPRRVNGTIAVSASGVMDIDLREPPVLEAGRALAQAIREYIERWPSP